MRLIFALVVVLIAACSSRSRVETAKVSDMTASRSADFAGEVDDAAPFASDDGAAMPEAAMPADVASPQPAAKPQAARRMVHHDAFAKLSVDVPQDTLRSVEKMAGEAGGYTESLKGNRIVVRVPAAQVKPLFKRVLGLGIVLEKRLSAEDITDQFRDTALRLRTSRNVLDQLKRLLAQTRGESERLAILRDIQNLLEEIEQQEAMLNELAQRAAFSTFTVEAMPRREQLQAVALDGVAAFAWIAHLNPMVPLHLGESPDFETPIRGFVKLEKDDRWMAESADGATFRPSVLPNTPRGKPDFWHEAVRLRLQKRFVVENEETIGAYRLFRMRLGSGEPVRYHVALAVDDEELRLVEVTYLSPEQETRHAGAVRSALEMGVAK